MAVSFTTLYYLDGSSSTFYNSVITWTDIGKDTATAYNTSVIKAIGGTACTAIGERAFENCSNLTTANFSACTTISNCAFYDCSNLTTVDFPECTTISNYAFYSCSKLTTANFSACTTIGSSAFEYCSNLTTVSFPECTTISNYAFYSCPNLTTASFSACTTIGNNAFIHCSKLTSLYLLGSSVCTLSHSNAFNNTPIAGYTTYTSGQLGSIYVPSSMLTTYKNAENWSYFANRFAEILTPTILYYSNGTSATFYNSVITCSDVGTGPSGEKEEYTSVIKAIGGINCISIGETAFNMCVNLTTVSFPFCTIISDYAFNCCNNLTTVSFQNCTIIGECAFSCCRNLSIVSFSVCTTIYQNAFYDCSNLTTASFPACTTIDGGVFCGCSNLTSVYISNATLHAIDNGYGSAMQLVTDTSTNTILYTAVGGIVSASNNSITSINNHAFARCKNLTTANFSACTTIGNNAFYDCSNLTTANFSACTIISSWAFQYCSNLTTASFPACTTIGESAFAYCSNLTTANFSVCTTIRYCAFYDCSNLTTVDFPECTTISNYAFYSCPNLTTASFPVCITIGSSAFAYCSNLTTANFSACTIIDEEAFDNCSKLTSLYLLGSSVCTLSHSNAFNNTPIAGYTTYTSGQLGSIYVPSSMLTTYKNAENWSYFANRFAEILTPTTLYYLDESSSTFNNSIITWTHVGKSTYSAQNTSVIKAIGGTACTTISSYAFGFCINLTTANFPVCQTIGYSAFCNCYRLTTASFPACTTIGPSAFCDCSNLTTASFPACTTIGNQAFANCSNLTTISFPACTTIGYCAFQHCSNLTTSSFPACTTIGEEAFYSCSNLTSLYLTGSLFCSLSHSNAFDNTPIANGTGYIYVPQSLLETYKNAENWSYFKDQIKSIDELFTVVFKTEFGDIIKTKYGKKGDEIDIPTPIFYSGYQFKEWDPNITGNKVIITEDKIYIAKYSTILNTYNDIQLSVIQSLNTQILNKSFQKLIQNDQTIIPENNYIPNIWENKWFNTEAIPGYSKGYCCWRNAYTTLTDFLEIYGDQVYNYAQQNDTLKTYLISSWTSIKKKQIQDQWIEQYYNVISGYTDLNANPPMKMFDPLFDFGNATPIKSCNDRIEVYISLIGNNKSFLSDDSCWKNIVLSSQSEYNNYIQFEIDKIFEDHIDNYHYSGLLTNEDKVDQYLMRSSLSNFDINSVTINKVESHTKYINSDGFDYVVRFGKKEDYYSINKKTYKLYRWFRQWNSGYLEHGGIIATNSINKLNPDPSDYYISVDLLWYNGEVSSNVYNYPETSSSFYGNIDGKLYYSGIYPKQIMEGYTSDELKISQDLRYSIAISPVSFNIIEDLQEQNKIQEFAQLSTNGSGYGKSLTNDMNSFTTIEIHHIKNDSFCFTKNNTDNLSKNDKIQFYTYYTSGYSILILDSITIKNLSNIYEYTGSEIDPTKMLPQIIVKANRILVENVDYYVTLKNNTNIGTATISFVGIQPYSGSNVNNFDISKLFYCCSIQGIKSYYKYAGKDNPIEPEFNVYDSKYEKNLTEDSYLVSYNSSKNSPGIKTLTITGINDYFRAGSLQKSYEVYIDINNTDITLNEYNFEYNGYQIKPSPIVKIGNEQINQVYNNPDYYQTYKLKYYSNINVGTGIILVEGTYSGSKQVTFQIIPISITKTNITITKTITFDLKEHKILPTIEFNGKILIKDTDYKCSYLLDGDYINVGEKQILIDGIGNFKDQVIVKYNIVPAQASDVIISEIKEIYSFTNSEIIPEPLLTFNGIYLINNSDYTISKDPSTNYLEIGQKKLIVNFNDNFEGTKEITYMIKYDLSEASIGGIDLYYYIYEGEKKPVPTTVIINGKILNKEHYSVTYPSDSYSTSGRKIVKIIGKDNYSFGNKEFEFIIIIKNNPETIVITDTNVKLLDIKGILTKSDLSTITQECSIIIGSNVTGIDDGAFEGMTNIKEIDISNASDTLKFDIPVKCFKNCNKLEKLS